MVQSGNETRPRAGGGFPVAPKAYLNDGILDLMVVVDFRMRELGVVLGELENIDDPENRFMHYRQSRGFEIHVPRPLPINLDGEPYRWDRITFKVHPGALFMLLPEVRCCWQNRNGKPARSNAARASSASR
jgi:diacylglycerol kinase family enzyme